MLKIIRKFGTDLKKLKVKKRNTIILNIAKDYVFLLKRNDPLEKK